MKYLESNAYNLLALVVMVIIATVAIVNAPYPDGTGMALLITMWIPVIVGVVTAAVYGLIRVVAGKLAWVATILGILFLLALTISSLTA